MDTPQSEFYSGYETKVSVLFDLRHPGSVERLNRELVAWREFGTVERVTESHRVLVVYPGGALKCLR